MELLVFSNKQDIRKSFVIAGLFLLVILFITTLIHITSVTDPPVHSEVTKDVPLEFLELNFEPKAQQGGSPGGSGTPSMDQLNKTNPPQQKELLTTTDANATAIQSGKSNKTNTDKPTNNTATTPVQGNNPFASGGSGGGDQGGSGGVFGSDNGKGGKGAGTGNGDGNGSGKARTRYNNISTDNIYTNSEVKVVLILQVDESGKVIGTRTVGTQTTTKDQNIINKVASACKAQLKYAKGDRITEEYYTAVIRPQ